MASAKEDTAAPDNSASRWRGLGLRVLSSLALTAIILAALFAPLPWFAALILLAAMRMWWEWHRMTRGWGLPWAAAGFSYILTPCAALLYIKVTPWAGHADGTYPLLYLLTLVIATDIGAYFTGRLIGGPKLAPAISPNKTWAGLLGGTLLALIAAAVLHYALQCSPAGIIGVFLAPVFTVVAQAGDFFESWIKRKAGVKDAGALIPGHGGLLDRVDGYMFTAPLLAFILYCFNLA